MRKLKLLISTTVLLSLLFFILPLAGDPGGAMIAIAQAGCCLRSSVIGAAGSPAQSTNYATNGTMGQPTPIGIGTISDVTLYAGFWGSNRIVTDVEEIPPSYRTMLYQNFPNPFNPVTVIEYSLAAPGHVRIEIYDVSGRIIKTLVDGLKSQGPHREIWDGKNDSGMQVASGVFFCRLRAGSYSSVKKMILLR